MMNRRRRQSTPRTITQKATFKPENSKMATHLLTGVDLALEGAEKAKMSLFHTRDGSYEHCDMRILKAGMNV